MSVRVLSLSFDESHAFGEFVDTHLAQGRAVVPASAEFDLFDDVVLRLLVGGRTIDVPATVAHPALPQPDGTSALGLSIQLPSEVRAHLATLRASAGAATGAAAVDPLTLTLESTPQRMNTDVAPEEFGKVTDRIHPGAAMGFDKAAKDYFAEMEQADLPTDPLADPWGDEDFSLDSGYGALDSRSRPAATGAHEQPTPIAGVPAVPADRHAADHDTPWSATPPAEGNGGPRRQPEVTVDDARYRARFPEKAMRADDYFEAAKADLRTRSFEEARTNANLAIAYNPTEPSYRELLVEVERRLSVRS